MQYSIQNLGLTVPGQRKAEGYYQSTGVSLGFGERHDPMERDKVEWPGPGAHEVRKDARVNNNPKWK